MRYIPRLIGVDDGEGRSTDDQARAGPADLGDRAGLSRAGGRGRLAEGLNQGEIGGSGGPPSPGKASEPPPAPRRWAGVSMSLVPPGERRIFRLGGLLFRVWADRPEASAELYRNGDWVWTPIPSESIMAHPRAEELSEEEVGALDLAGASDRRAR